MQVQQLLEKLRVAAEDESQNFMPVTIDLVKAGPSMGDIVENLRELWGPTARPPLSDSPQPPEALMSHRQLKLAAT